MPEDARPNPDALLASIREERENGKRGALKIFFGMCPGVGKTYAMLQAARKAQSDGVRVLVGVAETHGRLETEALLAGLEIVPRIKREYRGATVEEMNLDALLELRPELAVVDELAHTNAPGSRHPKRWQDVWELLDAGIGVHTTLNVQHLESRRDVVRQITGVWVRETVPDSVLDRADEIEIIDLTPEQLRARLAEGKVYLGDRAHAAAANFFRESNLAALREIALRVVAEHVDRGLIESLRRQGRTGPLRTSERLLVAVGPSPFSESLIRWTRRMAGALNATWLAAHVGDPLQYNAEEKARLARNLTLARELGAEVVSAVNVAIASGLLQVAVEQHVTQIVVGKPAKGFWRRYFGGHLVDRLLDLSGDIDVWVVKPEKSGLSAKPVGRSFRFPRAKAHEWLVAFAVAVAVTLVGLPLLDWLGYFTIALIFLLATVFSALWISRAPLFLLAVLGGLCWNFFFVPPRFTFEIGQAQDRIMFVILIVVALVMGSLTSRLKQRERLELDRRRRTNAMLEFTQQVVSEVQHADAVPAALGTLEQLFAAGISYLPRGDDHNLKPAAALGSFHPDEKERSVAAYTYNSRRPAGRFTDTLPAAQALWLPLQGRAATMGVLGLRLAENASLEPTERAFLEALVSQLALLLEKEHIRHAVMRADVLERSEQLRRTLFEHVSHELQTPVAVIRAAVDALQAGGPRSGATLAELRVATRRLEQTVTQLVKAAKLEAGAVKPNLVWCEVRDLLDSARETLAEPLQGRTVSISIPPSLPLVKLDADLIQQAVENLLSNAAGHTPSDTPIELGAALDEGRSLSLTVRDHGPGVPDSERIFDRFLRGEGARPGGIGLGLSIARGFVQAHGGTITAHNHPDGGAEFTLRLPVETQPQPA